MIYHKPVFEFGSVFAPYIRDYLELKDAIGEKCVSLGNILRQFDRYCCSTNVHTASLSEGIVNDWLVTKTGEKQSTHATRISALKCFSKHLLAVGLEVSWNPVPGYTSRVQRYTPYIFTKNELSRIFASADAMPTSYGHSQFHLVFPAVLRVLYGCGLRVSEALALKVKDVDLESGFLLIRAAKFDKSRKLPISNSLLHALRKYRTANATLIGIDEDGYFFPNSYGECYSQRTIYDKFRAILWQSDIPHQGKGKGPRVHDIRYPNLNKIQTLQNKAA